MTIGAASSTIDIISKVVQDCGNEMIGDGKDLSSCFSSTAARIPGPDIEETIRNMTSTSCSYSSSLDASRSHLRLKMSGGTSKSGLVLPNGRSSMKIPSLLQRLPCHGPSNSTSSELSSGTSAASNVTLPALSVIEKSGDNYNNIEFTAEKTKLSMQDSFSIAPSVNLDSIDLEKISIVDLNGLQAADGDTLRAKYLNKLSRREREHVLQDIHGVADAMEEATNILFVDDSLQKLQAEIDLELSVRKASKEVGKNKNGDSREGVKNYLRQQEITVPTPASLEDQTPKQSALEEQLGKLQEKLDLLVRRRNNLDSSMTGGGDFSSCKQLSAKHHPMFGKLGDNGGFGSFPFGSNSSSNNNKNDIRPSAVPSSFFGGSSSFFSPTTAMAKSSLLTSTSNANESQEDDTILASKDAIAYEQALAQCRWRRRERNNSLFRPNLTDYDDNLDESLYIDVEQREFRLSFLRAERYNIKKAATRVIDYFEEKRRLFGVETLTSKITLNDLDADSKDCLESGQVQLLPGRDRAGRAVIVGTKKLANNKERRQNKISILRAFWILCSIALEDVETENNGVVFVIYDIGDSREYSSDAFRHRICDWGSVLQALPLRVASMHWCVENHTLKQAANLSALMLGGSIFARVRCHAGSDMEVQYDLMTFGIPTDLFPVSMTGIINLSSHLDFLKQRKKIEASTLLNKALALVESPMLEDCIALGISDDEQNLESKNVESSSTATKIEHLPTTHLMTSGKIHNSTSNNFEQQNQKLQEFNQTAEGYGFNSMNKMTSSSFNDSFPFIGNRNPLQVQSSMQQQYEQRRQRLNGFQQQHLGMNMNMGMVHQFPQGQQIHQDQSPCTTAESKSGIAYSMEPVLVPGELDILLGRGRGAQNHKGNIHYRQVVETFRSRYEQIPQKGAKTQLIREVVAVIYDNGGRFLKQDGFGRWIPVDPEVARDKVSHSFRNQKRLSTGASTSTNTELSKKRSRNEASC